MNYRIGLTIFYFYVTHIYTVLCLIAFCQLVRINGLLLLEGLLEGIVFYLYVICN